MPATESQPILVNFSSLAEAIPGPEAAVEDLARSRLRAGPAEEAELGAEVSRALARLAAEEAALGSNVLVTAQDRAASLLQSILAERAESAGKLERAPAGARRARFDRHDLRGWARTLWQMLRTEPFAPVPRPAPAWEELPARARVGLCADWGTGLYGAPVMARTWAAAGEKLDLLMHLGDVYYSGTPKEIDERFLALWPRQAAVRSRALNSNHEMYSGGHGYFGKTLPALHQAASYVALANDDWLLVGLDTGYVDHDLDAPQLEWLAALLERAGDRKVILFSHHQLFSRLESQGEKLAAKLAAPLAEGRIFAWYWGHEHLCAVYEKSSRYQLFGRCVGHAGMPYARKRLRDFAVERREGIALWRRLPASNEAPAALVLDGENPYLGDEKDRFGPHGYVTLELDGPRLTERYHQPDGLTVLEQTLA